MHCGTHVYTLQRPVKPFEDSIGQLPSDDDQETEATQRLNQLQEAVEQSGDAPRSERRGGGVGKQRHESH